MLRGIGRLMVVAYCHPISNIGSKTSDFGRPKKAVFKSDKEILEIG